MQPFPNSNVVRIRPPAPDEEYSSSDPEDDSRDPSARRTPGGRIPGDRETVRYKSFYGDREGSTFGAFDPAGYLKTNFYRKAADEGDGGLWRDRQSLEDQFNPTGKAVFEEDELPNARDQSGPKKSRKEKGASAAEESKREAKNLLLKMVQEKFFDLISPLTRFVSRYLAFLGEPNASRMSEFIKIRRVFDRTVENTDWEGLIRELYSVRNLGTELYDGEEGFSTEELADAVLDMVSKDHRISRYRATIKGATSLAGPVDIDDSSALEGISSAQIAAEMIRRDRTLKTRTAQMLLDNYNKMVEGKVVFLLDSVLRESSQSTLDTINEQCGREGRDKFTLVEIMRSDAPLNVFLKLVILETQTSRGFQPSPISPNPYAGLYGTMADRMSETGGFSGRTRQSEQFENNRYGQRTLIINSRPTVANLVSLATERVSGYNYFTMVRKVRGANGTVLEIKRKNKNFGSRNLGDWGAGGERKTDRSDRPIQKLNDFVEQKRQGMGFESASDYHEKYLSVRDQNGKLRIVYKSMGNDEKALDLFFRTGHMGRYLVPNSVVEELLERRTTHRDVTI